MTVSNTNTKDKFTTNGVTVDFPFTFYLTNTQQVFAKLVDVQGDETDYTNFTVIKNPDNNGGTLTTNDVLDNTDLLIFRDTQQTQETDYIPGGRFPAESHEQALDKLTLINQEQQEELDRSLKSKISDEAPPVFNPGGEGILQLENGEVGVSVLTVDEAISISENAQFFEEIAESPLDTATSPGGVTQTTITGLATLASDQRDEFDQLASDQRDNFDATFQAQFQYAKIGNISDFVGDSLPEADKLNSYQYPDDSNKWYGPIQNQTFPITIPADPTVPGSGWALVNALTSDSLPLYTDIVYKASGGNSAVENMISGNPISAPIGGTVSTGGTAWVKNADTGSLSDFTPISEVKALDFVSPSVSDLSQTVIQMMSTGYASLMLNIESGDFASPLPDTSSFNIRGMGKTKSLFTRSFDGLLFPVFGSGSELKDLQISGGNSEIIQCPAGSSQQKISRVRLIPDGGKKALVFEDQGGELIQCTSCTFGSGDTQVGGAGMVTGVVDSGGAQRHFTDCEGAGNPTIDLSGMNDTFVVNGFSTNGLLFDDNTSKAMLLNMRWGVSVSNPIDRVQVRGENLVIENIVGGKADLFCTSSRFSTIAPDYDVTDQGSGNMVSIRGRLYSPSLSGTGGIQPDLGNGSLEGFYSREGNKVTIQIELVWGSTSVLGNGAFNFTTPDSMPVVQSTGIQQFGGSGIVRSTPSLNVSARFFANERRFQLGGVDISGSLVDVGVSTPLSAGDRVWFQGEYYT